MQLKGCLLIGFVLNVACLNNLNGKFLNWKYDSLKADQISLRKNESPVEFSKKDPSSLVELFADQISLRKNESLVESLKKDPSSFVELFAKADPEKISQIIVILEGLITDAASSLETLRSHQTEATNNLDTANSNLVTADTNEETAMVALEQATTDKSNADSAHAVAVGEQESAQIEKDGADRNYDEQSPGLINEHGVLQEVIESLGSLTGYKKSIIIQSSQVAGVDNLINFPVLISVTDADLATVANGGKVQQANGFDIVFSAANGNSLNHQIEDYDAATGSCVVWVQIPSLSPIVDTEIYMHYGNVLLNTDLSSSSTWDSDYEAVWHMNSVPVLVDSTGNSRNGESFGAMTESNLINRQIGQAINFDGTDDYFALPFALAGQSILGEITVSAWLRTRFVSADDFDNWSILDFDRSEYFNVFITGNGRIGFSTTAGGIVDTYAGNNGDYNDGTWHYITAVYDNVDKRIYVDGALISTAANAHGGVALGTGETRFGIIGDGSEATSYNGEKNLDFYDGDLDEIRLSTTVRSTSWITTEYNNQNSPGTFYSIS